MGNGNFNENTRVQVPAALHLCKLGYTYLDSICAYDTKTNILIDIFLNAVKRLNPEMSSSEVSLLFSKIVNIANNDDLGREFYKLLSSQNGVKLIDFDNPDNNDWHITTEFTCENEDTEDEFRPDITCFVNGMPLAFIEVKKPNNHEGILAERERINKRMSKSCFRRFFNVTQLMIFSNNQEYDTENRVPIQGAFYCCTAREKAFFNVFREENKRFVVDYKYKDIDDDTENIVLKHRNCVVIKNLQEYQTNKSVTTPTNRIITSMLSKERFLFLLRYGFAYVERKIELADGTQGTELQKHIMRYQQLFATYAIRNTLTKGIKSGIIWHTQGSGKTALAYYNVRSLTDYFAKRNVVSKFYFIVDRIDLMEQATDEFAARGLIVHNVKSRKELMDDIASREITGNDEGKPEITVVNIQKFKEDKSKVTVDDSYSINLQRVFFIDEAHRGYNPQGSFLANLLEADQNAVKIALTGTPLLKEERESWRVFGNYIHTYYYDKSIADGYTRKLMREPVETVYKEKIENILDKLAGEVEVKKSDIDRNQIIEHDSYLNALLDYIISDFRRFRLEQNDDTVGAMIVCKTNPQARELYRLLQKSLQNLQDLFLFHPLVILQGIQQKSGLIGPLVQDHQISLKKLTFHGIISFVLHIRQQLLRPGAPLFCRHFPHAHPEKIPGCLQAFPLLIGRHIDLKLLPFGSHNLIGQCLVHGFDPDPSEVLAFSKIFPADNIFQLIDAADKMSVMDTLFLNFQEIPFHSNFRPQKSPAAAADPESIFQRRLDFIKLQIFPFQAERYRLFQIAAYQKFLQVLIRGGGLYHSPVTWKKIFPSGQKPCKRRLHKKLVRLPEIFFCQLHKVIQSPYSPLGGPDLRSFYLNRKRHPVFSDTGA